MKSGNLDFLEPSGPLQACNGTALLLALLQIRSPPCTVVMKSGNLDFLEPSGPLQASNGTALLLPLLQIRSPPCTVVMKSGNLNFLEPSGSLQARNGTAFAFAYPVKVRPYGLHLAVNVVTFHPTGLNSYLKIAIDCSTKLRYQPPRRLQVNV